jgi:hypothetical protein
MTDKIVHQYAIPLLPCTSINETENFYKALGAVITYKQKVPNNYIALTLKQLEIHFFAMKQLAPSSNFSSCYLVVQDIDPFYESCRAALKELFGKIPLKGFPRINPLKDISSYGVRQFIIVDPNGNYIRLGQPIKKTDSLLFPDEKNAVGTGSPLEKAYEAGSKLADAKGDFITAAKVLDKALSVAAGNDPLNLLKVLILRADLSVRLSEKARFAELLNAAEAQLALLPAASAMEERRLLAELKETPVT